MSFLSLTLTIIAFVVGVQPAAQNTPFPAPTGSYTVGMLSRYWIDESRAETYTPDDSDKRELIVYFWYPADVPPDAVPLPYLPDAPIELKGVEATFQAVGSTVRFPVETVSAWSSYAYADVPLARAEATYPVLIFSHGSGGLPRLHNTQLEALASHGYVVVAIHHPYGAAATVFPDGRVIEADFSVPEDTVVAIWSADQLFVLDQLETLNADDPEEVFTGRLNLDKIGILGQSMGGAASVKTCLNDARCKAVLSEDGFATPDVVQTGLTTPFLLMRNEDGINGQDQRLLGRSTAPIYLLTFAGFGHVNFSDAPLWGENIPLISSVEPLRATEVTNAYLLAFFNQYLKGTDETLLDGASADYPEVEFHPANT
jgi:pimeloyl-ACP methyl ester carboxylesterase